MYFFIKIGSCRGFYVYHECVNIVSVILHIEFATGLCVIHIKQARHIIFFVVRIFRRFGVISQNVRVFLQILCRRVCVAISIHRIHYFNRNLPHYVGIFIYQSQAVVIYFRRVVTIHPLQQVRYLLRFGSVVAFNIVNVSINIRIYREYIDIFRRHIFYGLRYVIDVINVRLVSCNRIAGRVYSSASVFPSAGGFANESIHYGVG
ncbi:MAG: hypothetical protein ACD_51C00063G0002 [uncultured bacterium]|nr:MAG: hypothetical protein ACD_51C00063G0002 [uncultured bacterium]